MFLLADSFGDGLIGVKNRAHNLTLTWRAESQRIWGQRNRKWLCITIMPDLFLTFFIFIFCVPTVPKALFASQIDHICSKLIVNLNFCLLSPLFWINFERNFKKDVFLLWNLYLWNSLLLRFYWVAFNLHWNYFWYFFDIFWLALFSFMFSHNDSFLVKVYKRFE